MYNRMYGTADGDRILQELGKILRRMFGRVPATWITGGQFVLLTQDVALEVMIPRLQRSFQALEPRTRMVLKVGIYETASEDEDVLQLVNRAKMACESIQETYDRDVAWFMPALERKRARRRQVSVI